MPDTPPLILIADDHIDSVDLLEQRLEYAGYRTTTAYDGRETIEQVKKLRPDLLLLDLVMPELSGIQVIQHLREQAEYQDLPIIVLTGKTEVEDRIAGLEVGADEYLAKPIEEAELLARVRAMLRMRQAILDRERLEEENQRLRREVEQRQGLDELIGCSGPMQEVYRLIGKVAPAPAVVLLCGESGTGKELAARAIHRQSPRADGPFVAVACGALPESLLESELFGHRKGSFTGADRDHTGLFEAAGGGILFLDEIGDVPLPTQVRLLRVLQEGEITPIGETQPRPIDARVIAATHKDLKTEVQEGRFREDLFFRLNVIPLHLPPLRQRPGDILLLAEHFLQRHCQALERQTPCFTDQARRLLVDYPWPGNVRELEHEMERLATLGDPGHAIVPDLLSQEVRGKLEPGGQGIKNQGGPLREQLGLIERQLLRDALEKNSWNQTRTAAELGLTRQGLIKKMQRYELDHKA